MPVNKLLDEIWTSADEARTQAATAYDELVKELGKPEAQISSDAITKHAGQMYVGSVRFMAELWLTPMKIANTVASDAAGGNGP